MDIMKLFEEYLPIWAKEKHQPIPKQENADRWALAWKDFLNEYLSEKYSELSDEYNNMKFKTFNDVKREQKKLKQEKLDKEMVEKTEQVEKVEQDIIETESDNTLNEEESEWDKVRKLLGK